MPHDRLAGAPPPADKSETASVAADHIRNWVACLRTRQKPVASAVVGHHSNTICILVNICRELGRKLTWDPVKEVFAGDDEANALRTRPRRKGEERVLDGRFPALVGADALFLRLDVGHACRSF